MHSHQKGSLCMTECTDTAPAVTTQCTELCNCIDIVVYPKVQTYLSLTAQVWHCDWDNGRECVCLSVCLCVCVSICMCVQ